MTEPLTIAEVATLLVIGYGLGCIYCIIAFNFVDWWRGRSHAIPNK